MFNNLQQHCVQLRLSIVIDNLIEKSNLALSVNNGNIPKWKKALEMIQKQPTGELQYLKPYLNINVGNIDKKSLERSLKQLVPWRKGPYQIATLQLDSEWRGDLKWDRISANIQSLKNKTVLDVGSGNGYFAYLMAMAGARTVLGIDPFLLFYYQFRAIQTLINPSLNAFVLPLSLAQMPKVALFDAVFSMGVLYHQKDHHLHLQQLKNLMVDDGELILETLIIDEKHGDYIIPKDRYAKMRNVYCLPCVNRLRNWLTKAGFNTIKLVDITKTTTLEQHTTHWIGDNAQSLTNFLHPDDNNLTIEGLPAPKRAIIICNK